LVHFFNRSAGAGGGWEKHQGQIAQSYQEMVGRSLAEGSIGGQACYSSTDGRGDGGFGGGGGGCTSGGGGGGYAGLSLIQYNIHYFIRI
jgi:anaplastic lymphoma kinase